LEHLKIVAYFVFAYLGIGIETFMILMIFMSLDSVVGAVKSVRLGYKFKFKILLMGFTLKLCFLIIPLTISLLGKALGYDFSSVVHISMSVLIVAEAYSILGNIYAAKNKEKIDKIDAVSMLLIGLRRAIKKILMNLISKVESKKEEHE
jgi:hypothetical protein